MNKTYVNKPLAVAVTLLFFSVSVIPSTGTTDVKQIVMPTTSGDTLYVGGNGANNYTKIQDAIDNVGNEETHQIFTIDMDQTGPDIEEVTCEFYKGNCRWYINFSCDATDMTSGMDRVEMYINDELYEINESKGPIYEFVSTWSYKLLASTLWFHHYDEAGNKISDDLEFSGPPPYPLPRPTSSITGLIFNTEISEETVSFFALIIVCNVDGIHKFKQLSFPNNYKGYIGRFLIHANFLF